MAVRSTMSDLIAKVRLLIGDPAGATENFHDQDVQNTLDRNRTDVRYELLHALVTLSPTSIQYLDYYSQYGYWEADAVLLGPGYVSLTPLSSELLLDTAHFTFASQGASGQIPPVFLAGKTYDAYGAAADLLEFWAAQLARQFAFTADGRTFNRQQQTTALMQMAALYRRQQRPKLAKMVRDDVNLAGDGAGDPRRDALGPVSAGVPFITGD